MKSHKSKFYNDQYAKVLESLTKLPKSALEISFETNVPLSSVYRKLKILEEKKLVQISGIFGTGRIRRIKVYKKSASFEELLAIGN